MKMLNTFIVILSLFSITGCSLFLPTISVYREEDDKGNITKIYTVIRKPENVFESYVKESKVDNTAKFTVPEKIVDFELTTKYNESVILLAEKLDQLNSQLSTQYKTLLLGLNAQPANDENLRNFWNSVGRLSNDAIRARVYISTIFSMTTFGQISDSLVYFAGLEKDLDSQIKKIEEEIAKLGTSDDDKQKKLDATLKELKNKKQELAGIKKTLSAMGDSASKLSLGIAQMLEQLFATKESIKEIEKEITQKEKELNEKSDIEASDPNEVKKQEKKKALLEGSIKDLKKRLENFKKEKEELEQKMQQYYLNK